VIYKIADKINRCDLVQLGAQSVPESDPPLLLANVSRLSKEIGWLPKMDLDGGLEEMIAWWQARKGLCANITRKNG
jgi:nucleoside-diphosphate-sugar epimerase